MKILNNIKAKLCIALSLSLIFATACSEAPTDLSESTQMSSDEASDVSTVEDASASLMWLEKFEGDVVVLDENGSDIDPVEGMKLLSGYEIQTKENSTAYVNLDDTKALKLDNSSSAQITNEDNKLLISLNEGVLFFNVTQTLEDDETMDIKTSNLITGIRGTAGIISENSTIILEGEVVVTDANADDDMLDDNKLSAGQMAYFDDDDDDNVSISDVNEEEIPNFVKSEIEDDDDLRQKIDDAKGFDTGKILNEDDDDDDNDDDDDGNDDDNDIDDDNDDNDDINDNDDDIDDDDDDNDIDDGSDDRDDDNDDNDTQSVSSAQVPDDDDDDDNEVETPDSDDDDDDDEVETPDEDEEDDDDD